MADGGRTPIRSRTELAALGYRLAIYPSLTGLAAAAAVANALTVFKEEGTSDSPRIPLYSFSDFNHLIGFDEVWEFERKWARPPPT
jgi:2-methylisocitrate lyase-like PEP mutase family enzyme